MEYAITHAIIYLIILLVCAAIGTLVLAMQKFKNSDVVYTWSLILSIAVMLAIEGSYWIIYFVLL